MVSQVCQRFVVWQCTLYGFPDLSVENLMFKIVPACSKKNVPIVDMVFWCSDNTSWLLSYSGNVISILLNSFIVGHNQMYGFHGPFPDGVVYCHSGIWLQILSEERDALWSWSLWVNILSWRFSVDMLFPYVSKIVWYFRRWVDIWFFTYSIEDHLTSGKA